MRLSLIGLSAAAALLTISGAAVAQQPNAVGSGAATTDAPAPASTPSGAAAGSSEDDSKMPPLPSMEGQQGEVISRTAVSMPLRKKHVDEPASPEKPRVSDDHATKRGAVSSKKPAKGKAKARISRKAGGKSAKTARAHRAPSKHVGHRKHH